MSASVLSPFLCNPQVIQVQTQIDAVPEEASFTKEEANPREASRAEGRESRLKSVLPSSQTPRHVGTGLRVSHPTGGAQVLSS